MRGFVSLVVIFFLASATFADNVLNVYTWSGVVPDFAIQQFEKETGIKVNFSTYDSNEIMYAKLKASKDAGYDIIEPSSYYIDRMRKQDLLEKIDKTKLSNFKNLNPLFLNADYDPHNHYSIPFIWGATGIFVNKNYYAPNSITKWSDLWDKKYENQLMLLDDSREVFSIALKSLGYSINDSDPEHIKKAYLKLRELLPNIKLFKSDGVITILIDEDANVGMAWNGDLYKAKKENDNLAFILPKDGFVLWIDNFAIPKNAPHRENAYKFLNFMLRADVAKAVSLSNNFPTPNLAAQKSLPEDIRANPIIYPSKETLRRGEIERDVNDSALELYEKYWEKLKMGG
ncbi:MAG: hypothetical protein ACD_60C00159G0009 [uncultured bacterium]|nr:MAG: hypothetical protein ACD_60C00159G0009 [uncultured bacterium]